MAVLDSMVRISKSELKNDFPLGQYTLFDREGNEVLLYDETEEGFSFPWSAIPYFRSIEDRRTEGRQVSRGRSSFIPREGQEDAVRGIIRHLHQCHSGLLSAACGTGKTVMGAEIAARMGMSTCIVVHKEFLERQWVSAFEMLSDLSVGQLRRDCLDTGKTHDVVVASTQSIINPKRDYPEEFYNSFGLLILDEVHRYGGQVWQEVLRRFPSKYRLGLTATPDRKDGLWGIIQENIGGIAYQLQTEVPESAVYMTRLDTEIPAEAWNLPWLDDTMKRAKLISLLANHNGRNDVIAKNILKAINAGRRILVISERKAQLEELIRKLKNYGVPKEELGRYVGGTSKKVKLERETALECQVIFTTYQMAKEGFDLEALDTLFMGTPQGDIIQTVGRILRVLEGKSMPMTVDFVDSNIGRLLGSAHNRLKQYKKMGCVVYGAI